MRLVVSGIIIIIIGVMFFGFFKWLTSLKKTKTIITNILNNSNNPTDKLIICAHPDDESIFAGDLLSRESFVLCLTCLSDSTRSKEFKQVLEYSGSKGSILDFPTVKDYDGDKKEHQPLIWTTSDIENCKIVIKQFINDIKPKIIYTHNEYGEYGHSEHVLIHDLVIDILATTAGIRENGFHPLLYVFDPTLNYRGQHRLSGMSISRESQKRKNLLDIYCSQGVDQFRNLEIKYKKIIIMEGMGFDAEIIENTRSEFDMIKIYKPGVSWDWDEWRKNIYMKDSNFENTQQGKELIKWNDKIWLHNWYIENNIPQPQLIYYSNTSSNILHIIEKLDNFVIKPSHCSSSMFLFIIKNNKLIQCRESTQWDNEIGGIDINNSSKEGLQEQVRDIFNHKSYHEDWPRKNAPPGIIIERLVPTGIEIEYTVVWGKVLAFIVDEQAARLDDTIISLEEREYDRNGLGIDTEKEPPHWWEEGLFLAEDVAKKARVDHVRIDIFYYNNEPVINEFTWNPGGEAKKVLTAKLLNQGYEIKHSRATNPLIQ